MHATTTTEMGTEREVAPSERIGPTDVVCLGETMVLLVPDPPAAPREARTYRRTVGGAESNVAITLARRGRRTSWVSAVGADAFGAVVREAVAGEGVECGGVRTVPDRPTGLYVKELGEAGTTVVYYRAGSAATTLGLPDGDVVRARAPRVLHTTGITAVLSTATGALVRDLFDSPPDGCLRSFDVNYRPRLHTRADAGLVRDLADAADVVFCGVDEAEALWGVSRVADVPALFPGAACVVVKQGADGATGFRDGRSRHVPAPAVAVVEPVGAGDAMAAGFLDGLLDDAGLADCLARGTALAGRALSVRGDLPDRDGTGPEGVRLVH